MFSCQVNTVVLCGIETHACIRHTAIDLIDQGFNVHVVVDACSSRTMVDRYELIGLSIVIVLRIIACAMALGI